MTIDDEMQALLDARNHHAAQFAERCEKMIAARKAGAPIGEQKVLADLAEYSRQALQDARLDALEWMMRQMADALEAMGAKPKPPDSA